MGVFEEIPMKLADKTCSDEGSVPPLKALRARELLKELGQGWKLNGRRQPSHGGNHAGVNRLTREACHAITSCFMDRCSRHDYRGDGMRLDEVLQRDNDSQ
jgi:hypothetical protein